MTTPPTPRRSLRIALLIAALLVLLAGSFFLGINLGESSVISTTSPTPTPTPVIHTYHISVNAQQYLPGIDTKVALTTGDHLTIKATGTASDGAPDCSGHPTNPNGISLVNGKPCTAQFPSETYPAAPVGTLLGIIAPAGTQPTGSTSAGFLWFVIGSSYSVTVWTDGELYLIYNDSNYLDNSGSYQVTITVVQGQNVSHI